MLPLEHQHVSIFYPLFQLMNSLLAPVKAEVKSGQFTVPGGYKSLKVSLEDVEKKYQKTSEKEEMGPKFSEVLIRFQNEEVFQIKF